MMSLVICEMETKSEEASTGLNVAERADASTFQRTRSPFSARGNKKGWDDRQDGGRSFICSAALGGPCWGLGVVAGVTSVAETFSSQGISEEAALVSE